MSSNAHFTKAKVPVCEADLSLNEEDGIMGGEKGRIEFAYAIGVRLRAGNMLIVEDVLQPCCLSGYFCGFVGRISDAVEVVRLARH